MVVEGGYIKCILVKRLDNASDVQFTSFHRFSSATNIKKLQESATRGDC